MGIFFGWGTPVFLEQKDSLTPGCSSAPSMGSDPREAPSWVTHLSISPMVLLCARGDPSFGRGNNPPLFFSPIFVRIFYMFVIDAKKEKVSSVVVRIVLALRQGKVVACPTDTVYGFLADAGNAKAVQEIFAIKGREKKKPLPVFVKNIATAKKLAMVTFLQEKLLKKFWPGRTTFVLKSKGVLAKETGTKASIGLRIPKSPLVLAVLKKLKRPLAQTSANLSGLSPCMSGEEIMEQFLEREHAPYLVVDAGRLPKRRSSRVVDIMGLNQVVLRR